MFVNDTLVGVHFYESFWHWVDVDVSWVWALMGNSGVGSGFGIMHTGIRLRWIIISSIQFNTLVEALYFCLRVLLTGV